MGDDLLKGYTPPSVPISVQNKRKKERESARQWVRAMVDVVGECYWCSTPLKDTLESTIDHVIPVSKGGTSDLHNIVLCCEQCNNAKKNNESLVWGARLVHWAIRYIRERKNEFSWKDIYGLIKSKPAVTVEHSKRRPIGEGVIKEVMRRGESKSAKTLRERYAPSLQPFEPMTHVKHGYDKHVLKRLNDARENPAVARYQQPESLPTMANIWPT